MNGHDDESLAAFAARLLREGRAVVPPWRGRLSAADGEAACAELAEADAILRRDAGGEAPAFDARAALWALRTFHWAAATLLDRAEERTRPPKELAAAEPDGSDAAEHWSVDIVLRFWPDCVERAERAAADDPLCAALAEIAGRWPLSSIGTAAEEREERVRVVWNDPVLRRCYVDRVLQRADHDRARRPEVRRAIAAAVGDHAELAGALRDLV